MKLFGRLQNYIIIVLLLLNLILAFNISRLRSETHNTYNSLKHNITEIKNSLSSAVGSIKYEINEANKWLIGLTMKTDITRSTEDSVIVNFEFTFSEMDKDAEVYMLYRADGKEWIWAETFLSGGLNYNSMLELDPKQNYEYQVIAESGRLRSTEILAVPEDLYSYEKFDTDIIRTYDEDMKELQEIVISLKSRFEPPLEKLGISEIKLMAYKDNNLVDSVVYDKKPVIVENGDNVGHEYIEDETDRDLYRYVASYSLNGLSGYEFYNEYRYKDGHVIREYIKY